MGIKGIKDVMCGLLIINLCMVCLYGYACECVWVSAACTVFTTIGSWIKYDYTFVRLTANSRTVQAYTGLMETMSICPTNLQVTKRLFSFFATIF